MPNTANQDSQRPPQEENTPHETSLQKLKPDESIDEEIAANHAKAGKGSSSVDASASSLVRTHSDGSEPESVEVETHSKLVVLWPILAVIGGSLIGPVNNFLPTKDYKVLTQVWRYLSTCFGIMIIFPSWCFYKWWIGDPVKLFQFNLFPHGKPSEPVSETTELYLKAKVILVLFVGQLMSAGWSFGMTWASFNVVQSHSYVLTGLHSPAVLLLYMLRCQKTHRLQKIGTLIVIVGAFLMIIDPNAKRVGEEVNIWKSVQALQACIPGALFWECNDYAKVRLDLVTKSILQFFIITSYFLITTLTVEGTHLDMSDEGIFGMLRPENWYIAFFWSGLWGGFFGYFAYCIAPAYFSSLVVMNCLLIEPFVSQMFALFLDIDEMPGILTWGGTIMICFAINVIHKGSEKLNAEVAAELEEAEGETPQVELASPEKLKMGVSVA